MCSVWCSPQTAIYHSHSFLVRKFEKYTRWHRFATLCLSVYHGLLVGEYGYRVSNYCLHTACSLQLECLERNTFLWHLWNRILYQCLQQVIAVIYSIRGGISWAFYSQLPILFSVGSLAISSSKQEAVQCSDACNPPSGYLRTKWLRR